MRVLLQHRSRYLYPSPAALGPHRIRLRPAAHTKARIESYSLTVAPEHRLLWQQDPHGNHVARLTFKQGQRTDALDILVEITVDIRPVNPFDFFVDDRARTLPFVYPDGLDAELSPFLDRRDPAYAGGPLLDAFLDGLPAGGDTVGALVAIAGAVNQRLRYVIRDEAGVWTPEESLAQERGSCRDAAVLLVAALRSRGVAARFVSGYLVQLADEGMLPDQPRGVGRDVVDLHAWAEAFLPGAGWIGLDGTSGLLCGEGHIPLAGTASPAHAAPLDGTSDVPASGIEFATSIARLGHEVRPTAPFTDAAWAALLAAGDAADRLIDAQGLTVTVGGEPTFNARVGVDLPEWNGGALGESKWQLGRHLASELRTRLTPGAAVLTRQGKHYPGEPLPRWALDLIGHRDGRVLWPDRALRESAAIADAATFAHALSAALGLAPTWTPAKEDPWRLLQDEAALPVELAAAVPRADAQDRARLTRLIDAGADRTVGWVLPLARTADDRVWLTEQWTTRRAGLFLMPGDSPLGLRLPLAALGPGRPAPAWADKPRVPDPRVDPDPDEDPVVRKAREDAATAWLAKGIRTALCVEPRDGQLWVFLPPLASFRDFVGLLGAIDHARVTTGLACHLEGYSPPPSADARKLAVTPDPGVLEVNIAPTASCREAAAVADIVFDAALHAGLHAEKYLLDGRMQGSGGGNHITIGGPTPLQSPWLARPDLLASFIAFVQAHPSLAYLFSGLFVGPTSQAPRLDEARLDSLYELELALPRLHEVPAPAPWMIDAMLRHMMCDLTGSTHRTELSIDKLFDPQTAYGRQGLLEMRAFEMPPHPRMWVAQVVLVRALVAALAVAPYRRPLRRFGTELHDRYLLPYWLWQDFTDVIAYLGDAGVPLPLDAYRTFLELRCPLAGQITAEGLTLEVRNALEPWHVLGEEVGTQGTTRFVDSSMERLELRVRGLGVGVDLDAGAGDGTARYRVVCAGVAVPLRAGVERDTAVAGVRFRAWAPPHARHPHLGIHHPLRIELIDTWAQRSLAACTYHVWHPEGRAFDGAPLTRVEAEARRLQRLTYGEVTPWPCVPRELAPHPEQPYTLDLRRAGLDHPMSKLTDFAEADAEAGADKAAR